MKAMLSRRVGGPETLELEELPDPKPGPGEVLLAVKACGVNYPDVLIIEDRYQFKPPRPFAPGGEVAGVIDSVGPGVTQFKPGDRVIGSTISGGMAEKLVVEANLCIAMPAAMPFDEASALVLTYGTSIYALKDRAKLEKGETLLVLGAAGGVETGICALAIARGAIPPTINYTTPDPECDLDYVPNTAREVRVKHVLTNSYGFGGTNASLVLSRFS